jgi:hypothetical protein
MDKYDIYNEKFTIGKKIEAVNLRTQRQININGKV